MSRLARRLPSKPVSIVAQVSLALCTMMVAPHGRAATTSSSPVNVGSVSAKSRKKRAKALLTATSTKLTQKQILKSTQTEQVIGERQIAAAGGPLAGSAQALAQAPGVSVRGYGGISSTARYEIAVRGVKVGWSSVNGDVERNGLTVLFDGIPMNNLSAHNGGWDTNEIPIMQLISGVNVIYGPGNPATRWFDSVGGTINFVPVQPTTKAGGTVNLSYGSDQTEGANFIMNTGTHDGWSTVIGGGGVRDNTFRTGSFPAPSRSTAFFGKTVRTFSDGTFAIGGYVDDTHEFRPNFIPVSPILAAPGTAGLPASQGGGGLTAITVDGTTNTPLYSQSTTGYYSSLPESVWFKQLTVRDRMIYSKLDLDLSSDLTLHDMFWYRHGHRVHFRVNNYNFGGAQDTGTNSEYYNPRSDTYGNRIDFDWRVPKNLVKAGGSWIYQTYNTPYAGYNAAQGSSPTVPTQYNNDTINNTFLTAFLQDAVSPIRALTITPGVAAVDFQTSFFNSGLTYTPPGPPGITDQNQSTIPDNSKVFVRYEPSIGIRVRLNRAWSLYGNYAKTYQNPSDNAFGAYNSSATAVNLSSLEPVDSTDYEIGTKFFVRHDGPLRHFALNMNFYHDVLGHETLATFLAAAGGFATTEFASASASYDGFNIDAQDSPTWHWHMFANAAVARAHFISYVPGGSTVNYGGYPISYSPDFSASVGVNHRMIVDSLLITQTLSDQFTGRQYLFNNVANAPTNNVQMPSYNIMNASVGVRTAVHVAALSSMTITMGVTNFLNKGYNAIEYLSSGGYFGGNSAGAILADPGAPRQYYISLSAKF